MKENDRHMLMFTAFFIAISVVCLIYTKVTSDNKSLTKIDDLVFNETVFEVKHTKQKNNLGNIYLNELYMIGSNKDFQLEIFDDHNNKINYKRNIGETREEEKNGMIMITEYQISFDMPNTKYIKVVISKEKMNKFFIVDIRDFE